MSWKTEYLDGCITATRTCCEKDGCHGRQACMRDVEKAVSLQRYIFWMDELGI